MVKKSNKSRNWNQNVQSVGPVSTQGFFLERKHLFCCFQRGDGARCRSEGFRLKISQLFRKAGVRFRFFLKFFFHLQHLVSRTHIRLTLVSRCLKAQCRSHSGGCRDKTHVQRLFSRCSNASSQHFRVHLRRFSTPKK